MWDVGCAMFRVEGEEMQGGIGGMGVCGSWC